MTDLREVPIRVGRQAWWILTLLASAGANLAAASEFQQAEQCPPHDGHHQELGTLGYGGPGLYPGFQGFGLKYHLDYGYGGKKALGVGPAGGYPFYGGPGYPHPAPSLRRLGPITPFPHYSGPGGPIPGHSNYFAGVGPLVVDQPVVTPHSPHGGPAYEGDFGVFTGAIPYAETLFAPFTATTRSSQAEDGSGVSESPPSGSDTAPASDSSSSLPDEAIPCTSAESRGARHTTLGIDTETVERDGSRGLQILNVTPGSIAQHAGLLPGDVILAINGYLVQEPGNVTWILKNQGPGKALQFKVVRSGESTRLTLFLRSN
jgi:hypothetical protein